VEEEHPCGKGRPREHPGGKGRPREHPGGRGRLRFIRKTAVKRKYSRPTGCHFAPSPNTEY